MSEFSPIRGSKPSRLYENVTMFYRYAILFCLIRYNLIRKRNWRTQHLFWLTQIWSPGLELYIRNLKLSTKLSIRCSQYDNFVFNSRHIVWLRLHSIVFMKLVMSPEKVGHNQISYRFHVSEEKLFFQMLLFLCSDLMNHRHMIKEMECTKRYSMPSYVWNLLLIWWDYHVFILKVVLGEYNHKETSFREFSGPTVYEDHVCKPKGIFWNFPLEIYH